MNRTSRKATLGGPRHESRHPLKVGGARTSTFVPNKCRKRGVRKVVVGSERVAGLNSFNSLTPATMPIHDTPLARALGRCHCWQHSLDADAVADSVVIAQQHGLDKVTVNESLRLAPSFPPGPCRP